MDNKPTFDRSLLVPIFIGCFSIVGICLLLLAVRLGNLQGNIQSIETETPMQYQYLATEPDVALPTDTLSAASTEIPTSTSTPTAMPTLTSALRSPSISAATATSTTTVVPGKTNTPVTPSSTPLILNVTYDDADFKFNYTGNWIGQTNVSGAHQNTLHVSNTISDSVQLSFVGQKILINYQAGPSLGAVAILLDSADSLIDQSATETKAGAWESPVLGLSSHTITITHITGGAVNIDSITVVDLSTPTPTITPTFTATARP